MEDSLAEQAEQNVQRFLNPDHSIEELLQALDHFRQVTQACIFADFGSAEKRGARLWQAHTESRKYIHRALGAFRKQGDKPVETRHLSKLFLRFIKDAQVAYRQYILKLSSNFGGIPELQAVAHQVKNDALGESSQQPITPALRARVLGECHQTLIYLGDLSRYRAAEKVDKTPDFGPAIGYYSLACTLQPDSGMGHHQQAVVALEQRNHLRAIYHLYCAIVVNDPHPNAARNLKLEFDKTNTAWDRGDLIQKGPPNDPDASKRVLLGWYVRLQSMCFRGEQFSGYEELEREVLVKLTAEVQKDSLESSFLRMIKVNLAAQFYVAEKFQNDPIPINQQAFVYLFRFNIKTFTALLACFYDRIRETAINVAVDDPEELALRLDPTARRILPGLRLYSSWILAMVHLLNGLASDEFLMQAIDDLWAIYARTIDVIAQAFPIWDLEELPQANYLLEEDANTLGFKPLINDKTSKVWFDKQTGLVKPSFAEQSVQRVSVDDEMIARVKDMLTDGLFLANDDDDAPLKLRGTRITYGDREIEPPVVPEKVLPKPAVSKPVEPQKPLSYAAAASSQPVRPPPIAMPNGTSSGHSRQAQLSRMVDDLVDDDEGNNPVTPPQQQLSTPVVNGDVYSMVQDTSYDMGHVQGYGFQSKGPAPRQMAPRSPIAQSPSSFRTTPKHDLAPTDRAIPVSSLWNPSPGYTMPTSPHFPPGLPMGTLGSPSQNGMRGHSRVNSGSSIRNGGQNLADSWSSMDSNRRLSGANGLAGLGDPNANLASHGLARPLLFGAGGGLWSAGPMDGYHNTSPPNGQGG